MTSRNQPPTCLGREKSGSPRISQLPSRNSTRPMSVTIAIDIGYFFQYSGILVENIFLRYDIMHLGDVPGVRVELARSYER